ncbi:MAG: AAA family ATPase [Solirubrobacterales bacterium]
MAESRTCPTCAAANPERAQFCMSCGAALWARCPSCEAESPPGAKFCIECGTGIEAGGGGASPPAPAAPVTSAAPAAPAPEAQAPPEERRQATVLFADLSGYTAAAETMDPEAVKGLVDRTLRRLAAEIERYGGTIDKYIGDNVMGVFGAPVTHEDDPERAVRAGLAMQDAMEEINRAGSASHGVDFALRVGINSGEVMAGAVGGDRYTVIGDVVNVASRLQDAGSLGSVTVGSSTVRATAGAISYKELKPLVLRGKKEPVPAWEAIEVISAGPRRSSALRSESPLVGRGEEAQMLVSLGERVAREGSPHLVTVVGQAGVGKSRLLREVTSLLSESSSAPDIRNGQCPPYGSGIAYWALAEVIRTEFDILDADTPETAWDKLRHGVEELMREIGDPDAGERNAALIARPLGIEPPEAPAAEGHDPQRMREALFSAIRACIEAMALRRPLVLAFEDIHWADEGMLDLIEYLARWVRAPLLLICMARDELLERRPGWGGGRRNATSISLEPLSSEETQELVAALFPSAEGNGNGEVVGEVAERAGGNPLFAEEMVNRLLEEGSGSADSLPGTVQSLLAARLDSLDRLERLLLQHASVIGQNFWVGSLEQTAAEEGLDLQEVLTSLQEKDMLVPHAGSRLAGEREYAFKHALIRDVAYSMLPKSVRCKKHEQVGAFIEARAGERAESVVGLVAEHYARAAALAEEASLDNEDLGRLRAAATGHLEAAGDAAAALYSNAEALERYTQAVELAGSLDGAVRARVGEKLGDVGLRMGRIDPAVEIWMECLEHYRREEELERVGDLHRKIGAGLWTKGERQASIDHYQKGIDLLKDGPPCLELVRLYEEAASLYMHTGDNMLAIYASEKALRLAERLDEARAASRAHGIFGRVFGRIGDAEKARENLERSVELARGSDRAEAVRALLTLGYHLEVSEADYEGATAAYREALELAVELGDLPSQVELHAAVAQLAVGRGDWEEAESATEASTALAEREGLTGKLCFPLVIRGALHWRAGEWEEAADACRRAHNLGEQVGRSEIAYSALFWLAAALRDGGELAASEHELARALDLCERAGLIPQSLEATSMRAVTLAMAGRGEAGRAAAEEAERLIERLNFPIGEAATAEARGSAEEDAAEGAAKLASAAEAWQALGREIDSARCLMLRAWRLSGAQNGQSELALSEATERCQELGLEGLAGRARELVA